MAQLDRTTIDQVMSEAFGADTEAEAYRKEAIKLIESRTGLKRLEEVLRKPFNIETRAA